MIILRLILLITLLLHVNTHGFSQKINKNYQLKQNIKQDQLQYEFQVVETDAKEPRNFDESKTYYWLKSQQLHYSQGNASGLLLNGPFQAFYTSKQLAQKGYFSKGLKHGEWIYWYENGTIKRIENWHKGNLVKTVKDFDEQGKLISKTVYTRIKTTHQNGDSLIAIFTMNKKKIITVFDSKGKKSKIARYKNDLLHGRQEFYKNGLLERVENYEKGVALSSNGKK